MSFTTKYATSDDATVGTWVKSAGATYYELIDEPPPPNEADFIYCTALSGGRGRQTFGFTAFAIGAGSTGISVDVFVRAKKNGSGTANVGGALRVGGNYYDGAGVNPAGSNIWQDVLQSWALNPKTGVAWTVDDINGVGANALEKFGVTTSDSTPNIYCAQCYITVNYGPSLRELTQEVIESDVTQTDRQRQLFQEIVEVDGYDWTFVTGRILSGQFV